MSPGISRIIALALIVAGVFLFLDNLGVIPISHIGAYWRLALVFYVAAGIAHRRNATSLVWSFALVVAGVLLVLGNLHILRVTGDVIWPMLLIAFGATMLVNRERWGELGERRRRRWEEKMAWKRQFREMGGWNQMSRDQTQAQARATYATPVPMSGNQIHEAAVFFSLKRRVETDFARGELSAVFGSIDIDFNGAVIQLSPGEEGAAPSRRAVLEASAVFGSIDIVVPRDWRVIKEGRDGKHAAGVFGSYDDRTIPARPEPGVEPPTLVIRGEAVFGSLTIHN